MREPALRLAVRREAIRGSTAAAFAVLELDH
jgi:hypothetical protein